MVKWSNIRNKREFGWKNFDYITLANRVLGPYCKLRTEFFPVDLLPKREAINQRKKRGSVTYSTDRENEVSKIFFTSLKLIGRAEKNLSFKFSGR